MRWLFSSSNAFLLELNRSLSLTHSVGSFLNVKVKEELRHRWLPKHEFLTVFSIKATNRIDSTAFPNPSLILSHINSRLA